VSLRASAENLSNADIRFIQGGLDQRVYTQGRIFTLQFGYSGF
jgi:hypothetical protein